MVKDANPPEILARTELDSVTYSAPVFADDGHMYVRTRRSLTCFATSPEGEKLVQEKGVTELFFVKSKLPDVPPHRPIQEVEPLANFKLQMAYRWLKCTTLGSRCMAGRAIHPQKRH